MGDFYTLVIFIVIIISIVSRILKAQEKARRTQKTGSSPHDTTGEKPAGSSLEDLFGKIETTVTKTVGTEIPAASSRFKHGFDAPEPQNEQSSFKGEFSEVKAERRDSGKQLASGQASRDIPGSSVSTFETTTETREIIETSNPLRALDRLSVYKRAIVISEILGKPKGFL